MPKEQIMLILGVQQYAQSLKVSYSDVVATEACRREEKLSKNEELRVLAKCEFFGVIWIELTEHDQIRLSLEMPPMVLAQKSKEISLRLSTNLQHSKFYTYENNLNLLEHEYDPKEALGYNFRPVTSIIGFES